MGPKLHGRKTEGTTVGLDGKARLHSSPTDGGYPEASGFILAAVDAGREADPLRILPLKRELSRMLQDQDRPFGCVEAAASRLRMTLEVLAFADPVVKKKQ